MKKFTKLLMAVVLFASYSCVQDTTEDLMPVLPGDGIGGGEVATLQVSIPTPTKTALGEKDGDVYPLYWCDEDVLAVNGKPTSKIELINPDESGKSSVAKFDLPYGVSIPYNLVYPYQGEEVAVSTDGEKMPVVFAAEQVYTEGTFADGSAPMYGWSDGFSDISMKHLATALRFSIYAKSGEVVKLKYVSVSTVKAEPIAGEFDVDCKTGELTARDSASSVVFYNFPNGEPHQLGEGVENASVFYIAVPQGEYSRFEVNFVDVDGGVHKETFDATGEGKKLTAGKVREFPVREFKVNSTMFLIGNDVDMMTFAEEVKAGTFDGKYDGALVVADIDMTEKDKDWTPIDNFASVFEGRSNKISGLTKPLFGKNIVGTISNLSVEANIVEENEGVVGIVARSLATDGDKVGTIFNCRSYGSITYQNTAIKMSNNLDLINVGGVVGTVKGGSVSNSMNNAAITINKAGEENYADEYNPCIGGIVGYVAESGESVVSNNTNNAVIIWDDQSKGKQVTPFIGGVAGYVTAGSFSSNVNTNELYINEPMYDLDWGGVIGASKVAVTDCENKGLLSINEAVTTANIGGVLGRLEATSITNCKNSGKIEMGEAFYISQKSNIGGVIAYAAKGSQSITDCSNLGAITFKGTCYHVKKNEVLNNATICIGGVVGTGWSNTISGCENGKNATLLVQGQLAGNNGSKSLVNWNGSTGDVEDYSSVGGIVGSRCGSNGLRSSNPITMTDCHNYGNVDCSFVYYGGAPIGVSACVGLFDSDIMENCSNDGSIEMSTSINSENTTRDAIHLASLLGYINSDSKIITCVNGSNGTVKYHSAQVKKLYIAGILGNTDFKQVQLSQCANEGKIIVDADVVCNEIYVGGIMSSTETVTSVTYPNCYNSGDVISKGRAEGTTYMGSIFGKSQNSDKGSGTEGIRNSGSVTYSGESSISYVGGYCGLYAEDKHSVQFTNSSSGTIMFDGKSEYAYVGGYAGKGEMSIGGKISASNAATIEIKGFATQLYVGGGFGYAEVSNNGVEGLSNAGSINFPAIADNTKVPELIYMGGVFGYANMNSAYGSNSATNTKSVRNCTNEGNLVYDGDASNGAFIGGIVGKAVKTPIINSRNSGEIISTGHAGHFTPLVPQYREGTTSRHTDREVNFHDFDLAIGGVVGETDFDMYNCTNSGKISHTCNKNPNKIDMYGKTATSRFDVGGIMGRWFVPIDNSGAVPNYKPTKYKTVFSGLQNLAEGTVTIYGTVASTTYPFGSLDKGDSGAWDATDVNDSDRTNLLNFYRMNTGGIAGRFMDDTASHMVVEVNNCINNGEVKAANAGAAKNFNIGGVVGDMTLCHSSFTGCQNHGAVKVLGAGSVSSDSYFIYLGGIVGHYNDFRWSKVDMGTKVLNATLDFTDCTNTGAIYFGEVAESRYQAAGGILGGAYRCAGDTKTGTGESRIQLTLKFTRCVNGVEGDAEKGKITYYSTAMNIDYNYAYGGGILGTQNLGHDGVDTYFGSIYSTFDHCENHASVQFDRNNGLQATSRYPYYSGVGGIVGHVAGGIGSNKVSAANGYGSTLISCKNTGRIWGYSGYIGGIIGIGQMYVKITGSPEDPTINTGDIVVKRNADGSVILNKWYGPKPIYAGGIAGMLREWESYSASYPRKDMYATIEHAINEGAVGATAYAGGIAAHFFSDALSSGGLRYCTNTGDVYALEGATPYVGAMTGLARNYTISSYTSAATAEVVPVGVTYCQIGGKILRNATQYIEAGETNFWNCIYGGNWSLDDVSTVVEPYDGCTLYVAPEPAPEPTPEEGGEENTEPTARR